MRWPAMGRCYAPSLSILRPFTPAAREQLLGRRMVVIEAAERQASIAHQGRQQSRQRWLLGILLASLVLAMLAASGMGAVKVPLRLLVESAIGFRPLSADQRVILLAIRLPRILAAAMVGSALSVSGLLFQRLSRHTLSARLD